MKIIHVSILDALSNLFFREFGQICISHGNKLVLHFSLKSLDYQRVDSMRFLYSVFKAPHPHRIVDRFDWPINEWELQLATIFYEFVFLKICTIDSKYREKVFGDSTFDQWNFYDSTLSEWIILKISTWSPRL